jgi:hypothetical protein
MNSSRTHFEKAARQFRLNMQRQKDSNWPRDKDKIKLYAGLVDLACGLERLSEEVEELKSVNVIDIAAKSPNRPLKN